jgi:O-antigen/teichoic acid export membrane protein
LVVPFALGQTWEPAVVPMQILAAAGMASTIQAGTGPLIVALGRPGVLLVWNVGSLLGLGAVSYAAAPVGLVPLAVAVAAFHLARVGVGQELMLRRLTRTAPGELWWSVLPAVAATAGMLVVGAAALLAAAGLGASDLVRATAAALVAPATYLGILALAFPQVLADLRVAIVGVLPSDWRARLRRRRHTAADAVARSRF